MEDEFDKRISDAFIRARRNFILISSLFYIFILCDGQFSEEYKNSYFGITLKEADNLIWVCVVVWIYFLLRYIQNSEKMLGGFKSEWVNNINHKIKYFKKLIIKHFGPNAFHTQAHESTKNIISKIKISEFNLIGSDLFYQSVDKRKITTYERINLIFRKFVYCTFNTNPYLFEYVFPLIYGGSLAIIFPLSQVNWDNLFKLMGL